jgi:glucose-1-phosphate cytidylyltransferase
MKVVILAGGFGSRISEESGVRPKPMVEIGGMPILWHIMKQYHHFGFNDFVILLGYKGHVIKEFFANYYLNQNSVEINLGNNQIKLLNKQAENWKVTLLDTGEKSLTSERIKKAYPYLKNERFLLTYGDGLSNIDIKKSIESHIESKKILTMTLINPESKYGLLSFNENGQINGFKEKPVNNHDWINGGFLVCEPNIFDYILPFGNVYFEKDPLEKLANECQVNGYKHTGFWKSMDTLNDKNILNDLWEKNQAPWKSWN